jgi:hypothetical protein
MGAAKGKRAIGAKWIEPLNDRFCNNLKECENEMEFAQVLTVHAVRKEKATD